MKLKGIELPVNTVIIIVVGFLVLALIIYMVINGTDMSTVIYQSAFNEGCRVYVEEGRLPSTIMLGDVTNDGKADSLLTVCRLHSLDSNMDEEGCMEKCRIVFPYGEIGSNGGSSTICPTGTEAMNYCSSTGDSCGGGCYCSSGSTCAPLKNDGIGCGHSYECDSGCCNMPGSRCSKGLDNGDVCVANYDCKSNNCGEGDICSGTGDCMAE